MVFTRDMREAGSHPGEAEMTETMTQQQLEAAIDAKGKEYEEFCWLTEVVNPGTKAGFELDANISRTKRELLDLINRARALKGLAPKTRI